MLLRGIAELVALAASAVSVIWISRAVGPANLGYYAVALVAVQLGTIIVNLGLSSVGAQRIAQAEAAARELWPRVFRLRLGAAALLFVLIQVALASTDLLAPTLKTLLVGMTVAWLALPVSSEWVLVGQGRVASLSVVRIIGAGTSLMLAILLIRGPGDMPLLPGVSVASVVAVAIVSVLFARPSGVGLLKAPADVRYGPLLRDGWQYMKGELATFTYFSSDRFFLYVFATPAVVGLYEAAYKLIQPFYGIASVVTDAMFVRLAQALNTTRIQHVLLRYVDAMCFATIPLGFFLIAYAEPVVTTIYGPSFLPATPYLQLLGWVITFGFTSGVVVIPLIPWGRAKPYGDAVAAGAGMNIFLNAALVPPFGAYGAALATVAAKVGVTIIGLRFFRQVVRYPILSDFAQYLTGSAVALFASFAVGALLTMSVILGMIVFAVVYVAVMAVLRGWTIPTPLVRAIIRRRLAR